MIWDHSECLPRFTQVFFSSFCFCFKLLYMGKKRTFRFSFLLCDWFLFHNFTLASFFLFSVIFFNFYKIYSPIRSVILALHILSSSSWVSSSSVLHKLVNSERTTLFSSKHMRLLGIMWCVCVCGSVCMYIGKIE